MIKRLKINDFVNEKRKKMLKLNQRLYTSSYWFRF